MMIFLPRTCRCVPPLPAPPRLVPPLARRVSINASQAVRSGQSRFSATVTASRKAGGSEYCPLGGWDLEESSRSIVVLIRG